MEDVNWIFDFVMDIFKAPTWEVPIMSFIDENCIVFDNEQENKFAYSELHASFRDLAESLLERHLEEVSVTPEMFVKACEVGRNQRDVNKIVWDQISAIDDFMTFKKLMARRNVELEREAIDAFRKQAAMQSAVSEASSSGGGRSGDIDMDEEMAAAMQASLLEFEDMTLRQKEEMAELEEVIAQSLVLEKERARLHSEVAATDEEDDAPRRSDRDSRRSASKDDDERNAPPRRSASSASSSSSLAGAPRLTLKKYAPLPDIRRAAKARTARVERAEDVFASNRETLTASARSAALSERAEVDADALAARKRKLMKQRDVLMQRRAEERADKLRDYEIERDEKVADKRRRMRDRGLAQSGGGDSSGVAAATKAESDAAAAAAKQADAKREQMRRALCSRLKLDMLEQTETRQTAQFEDLDRALQQAEAARRANLEEERKALDMVRRTQRQHVNAMAASLAPGRRR